MVLVMIIVNVIFENIYFTLSALFQTSSSLESTQVAKV